MESYWTVEVGDRVLPVFAGVSLDTPTIVEFAFGTLRADYRVAREVDQARASVWRAATSPAGAGWWSPVDPDAVEDEEVCAVIELADWLNGEQLLAVCRGLVGEQVDEAARKVGEREDSMARGQLLLDQARRRLHLAELLSAALAQDDPATREVARRMAPTFTHDGEDLVAAARGVVGADRLDPEGESESGNGQGGELSR